MDMQAHAPVPVEAWDDEIDLRQLIESIWRRRWLIVGLIVAAVAAAGVVSYFVLPPRYESSITVDLLVPHAAELGLDPAVLQALATSNRVFEAMIQSGSLDMTQDGVRRSVVESLSKDSRLLTVTTRAQSASEARQLARLWYEAFSHEAMTYARERVGQRLAVAEAELAALEGAYYTAREALNEFDATVELPLLEARLQSLESELLNAEERLRTLTQSTIPADEARLEAIEHALAQLAPVLSDSNPGMVVPAVDSGAVVTTSDVTMVNPVYLQLGQDLASTQTRLATNRRSAELLGARVAELPDQIEKLRASVIAYREERVRLEREVSVLKPRLDQARAERDSLLALQQRATDATVPAVVSDPILPSGPVAPRKLLNMALAGFLAAFVGVFGALVIDFWTAGKSAQ